MRVAAARMGDAGAAPAAPPATAAPVPPNAFDRMLSGAAPKPPQPRAAAKKAAAKR